jgi:hypothetical protein
MKIIISCSDQKNGELLVHKGLKINFVSNKDQSVANQELHFHPDDIVPNEEISWRNLINQQKKDLHLIPAYELYKRPIYSALFKYFGADLFVFSAGWGIIKADYKLPKYNVTFSCSKNIPLHARRNSEDKFNDFNHLLGIEENERIVLIAGLDYVLPFCQLTEQLPNEKIIIFKNKKIILNNPFWGNKKFNFVYYHTTRRTNWHYEVAERLIKNEITF